MSTKIAFIFTIFILVFAFIPFRPSAAENHVVISEIQISGTTATDEFVELYNPTNSEINIAGWRLTKKVISGTQSNLVTNIVGTIPAYGHFLITHPTGYDGSISSDLAYSTSTSITPDNTVLLYSDGGITLVDKVGMGLATDFETAVFASNPLANSSIQRTNGQDTNNNSADFFLQTVSDPQNSQTIITPTSTPTPTPVDSTEPGDTPTPQPTSTATPTSIPTPTTSPTFSSSPTPSQLPITSPTPTATSPTFFTPSPTPSIFPTNIPTPQVHGKKDKDHIYRHSKFSHFKQEIYLYERVKNHSQKTAHRFINLCKRVVSYRGWK